MFHCVNPNNKYVISYNMFMNNTMMRSDNTLQWKRVRQ